ncbi:MAG: DUF2892 domain-containing protein [Planctomycetes bacterium]|nr:DUF2892 domain-containing protein [Planctomycetota bacterium]
MPKATSAERGVRESRALALRSPDANPRAETSVPWSAERWGRFLAGCSVLGFSILGLAVHPYFLAGTLLAAANLIVTSLTDRCPLRALLLRMGVKEREDLYLPGGRPRDLVR